MDWLPEYAQHDVFFQLIDLRRSTKPSCLFLLLLVVGCWLFVVGCWLLAVGCWLLVVVVVLLVIALVLVLVLVVVVVVVVVAAAVAVAVVVVVVFSEYLYNMLPFIHCVCVGSRPCYCTLLFTPNSWYS